MFAGKARCIGSCLALHGPILFFRDIKTLGAMTWTDRVYLTQTLVIARQRQIDFSRKTNYTQSVAHDLPEARRSAKVSGQRYPRCGKIKTNTLGPQFVLFRRSTKVNLELYSLYSFGNYDTLANNQGGGIPICTENSSRPKKELSNAQTELLSLDAVLPGPSCPVNGRFALAWPVKNSTF